MALNELDRALAREDAQSLIRQVDAYDDYFTRGVGDWPDEHADDFQDVLSSFYGDDEKSLSYVVIAAARSNDARFLGFLGATLLENVVDDPSPVLLDRIVAEACRSARFQWLLDCPLQIAFSPLAWEALKGFRMRRSDLSPYEPLPLEA